MYKFLLTLAWNKLSLSHGSLIYYRPDLKHDTVAQWIIQHFSSLSDIFWILALFFFTHFFITSIVFVRSAKTKNKKKRLVYDSQCTTIPTTKKRRKKNHKNWVTGLDGRAEMISFLQNMIIINPWNWCFFHVIYSHINIRIYNFLFPFRIAAGCFFISTMITLDNTSPALIENCTF